MKVRERLRGVRWQGTEVGSPFRQEMGWKTSGIQFWGFFWGRWFNPEREKNEQRERLNNVIWVHFAFEFVCISWRMSHCALFRWKYYFIRVCMWVQQMTAVFSTIVSQSFWVYVCDRVFPPRLEFGMWRQTEDISSFKRSDKSPIKPSSSSLHPVSFSLIFLHDMDDKVGVS